MLHEPSQTEQGKMALPALRFLTAGSVDDGKSTLMGRLFYDTQSIAIDQLESLTQNKANLKAAEIDFAKLSDGLQSERAKNITIDVAHRYLTTHERQFILLDSPGHEEYTRNMVTAASTCDAAVILVDATQVAWQSLHAELLMQTKRHAMLAHLLRIPSIVFAINKLDIVPDSAQAFTRIQTLLQRFAKKMQMPVAGIIPISALKGMNVVHPLSTPNDCQQTQNTAARLMQVYTGPSLLQLLTHLPNTPRETGLPFYFPVQWVDQQSRNAASSPTLWGRIAAGCIFTGDEVVIHPAGVKTKVKQLKANALTPAQNLASAQAGQSVGLVLESLPSAGSDHSLEIERGQWITQVDVPPFVQHIKATLIWLDEAPLVLQKSYWIKHGQSWVMAKITTIDHLLNLKTLQQEPATGLHTNGIAQVVIELENKLPLRPYKHFIQLGAFIVVDAQIHQTAAAGLVLEEYPPVHSCATTLFPLQKIYI